MLSLQGGANLKANLEKSEPSRVQTWFSFSFPFHFLDSLGGRLDPKNSKTSRKHLICSISILQSLMLFPLLKQKKQFLTRWSMIRFRHPPFKDKYRRPGRRHGIEWLLRNTTKTTDTTRNTDKFCGYANFYTSGSWWRLDQVELMGFSDYVALVATVGVSLLSYACLIGLVTPAIYWCAAWAMNIFEDGGRM